MRANLPGVRIVEGPSDWQILQRRLDGLCDIPLAGTWRDGEGRSCRVEVRVALETENRAPTAALDWQYAETRADGNWKAILKGVPAGGPYRIETRLQPHRDEWRLTGDRIHHVGVGDLWLIAGQSNAVGYGHGPVEDPPERGVHLFRASETWSLADHPLHDPTRTRHPANFDAGWNDHSPWLAFGRALRRELGVPIGLIPAALGGSPLSQWDPSSDAHPLYDNMMDLIRAACAQRDHGSHSERDGGPVFLPAPDGRIGRIAGAVWYQGCSDTGDEKSARSYHERFARFLAAVRGALESPRLPFITVQLDRCHSSGYTDGWGLVREAQRRAARHLQAVALVPTIDLGREALSDIIHLGPRANLVVGERAARAALGMVYGRPLAWKAPDVCGAAFERGDRRKVLLSFENVVGELWACAPAIAQFSVSDAAGAVPVARAELLKPDRVLLELDRPAGDRPRVHNGAGHDPVVSLLDREHRPILCFHEVEIA